MKMLSLDLPVKDLYMVGKTYASRLKKLDINTVEDLIHHYPFRYNDYSLISSISQVQPGETVTIQANVLECKSVYTKHGKKIQNAVLKDPTGELEAVWFNQPFIPRVIGKGMKLSLSGKVGFFSRKIALISPEYEIIKEGTEDGKQKTETIHTGRLVPVYPETYGVSSKWLRSRIAPLVEKLLPTTPDWLPDEIKKKNNLVNLKSALRQIHFPKDIKQTREARARLAFDELFLIQLATLERKKAWQKTKLAYPFEINQEEILDFISKLPFSLTSAQNKASWQILNDLKKTKPMNRLLEGDVGSGKTVVAAIALYVCFLNGLKSAFMAPTEILAFQHYQTIKVLLESLGVKIALLTGSKKFDIRNLKFDILVGTHALIYNKVKLDKLGLVVIDEQHRFGVEQRAKLIRQDKTPHVLTMTATPIPRTIALTLYGDLDLSVLDEMPPGRKAVKTWVVPWYKREAAYDWIETQIKKSGQVFIVCPLIEESLKESMKDIKAATAEFERLSAKVFSKLKLGLLHGRMKAGEKEKIINDFKDQKLDIIVSTPVVEVGIDIPNASIMMIEAADRFGLAQLHQLRGRVGRSHKQSYCLLFTSIKNKSVLKRLYAMQKYNSGFKLAEIDLKIRGPGEIYGTKQHGFINLKIASFSDSLLIEKTRIAAAKITNKLKTYPLLHKKLKNYTIKSIEPN